MKYLLLKAEHQNWCRIGPGHWNNTIWNIYSDGSYTMTITVLTFVGAPRKKTATGVVQDFPKLLQTLNQDPWREVPGGIEACDGDAWCIELFSSDGSVVKSSGQMDYIYGEGALEAIVACLPDDENMIKNDWQETAKGVLNILDRNSFPEVFEVLSAAIEHNPSEYVLANQLLDCDKPKEFPQYVVTFIVELFESEIEQGNADAMNDLGARFYSGDRGFEQDLSKAVDLYHMAAQHGNRQAQENLGYCYYYGRDVKIDYEKAFQYFALGAFDGCLVSLYKIGDMYLNGYYVAKNEKEAFLIYQRCLSSMDKESAKYVGGPVHLRLGNMFLNGAGVERNPEQAMWHYHAAEFFLYNMVKDRDFMYKKSLREAIEGQARAREIMAGMLPENEWTFDD